MAGYIALILENLPWLNLGVFLLIALYFDLRYNKIPNKLSGLFFVLGFLVYIIWILSGLSSWPLLLQDLLDFSIAALIGFALWDRKMWFAGDAKLFAVAAFLIPVSFYSVYYFPYFFSFSLLSNIFIPTFFYLLLFSLPIIYNKDNLKKIKGFLGDKISDLKTGQTLKGISINIFLAAQFSLLMLVFEVSYVLILMLMLLFGAYLMEYLEDSRFFPARPVLAFVFLEILGLSLFYSPQLFVYFLVLVLIRAVVYILVFFLISVQMAAAEKVRAGDLRPGEFLVWDRELNKKKLTGRPLSEEDIAQIRDIFSADRLLAREQTFPFIGFIIFGVLLTYLLKGQIVLLALTGLFH